VVEAWGGCACHARAPLNTRAMALTWVYAVDPMRPPLLFGASVFAGIGD
jgi:hypothetical protein